MARRHRRPPPPWAAPVPGRSYIVTLRGESRLLLVVGEGTGPEVEYPSMERRWTVPVLGPDGPTTEVWGEYSRDAWREVP